jgi:hypothetical protein
MRSAAFQSVQIGAKTGNRTLPNRPSTTLPTSSLRLRVGILLFRSRAMSAICGHTLHHFSQLHHLNPLRTLRPSGAPASPVLACWVGSRRSHSVVFLRVLGGLRFRFSIFTFWQFRRFWQSLSCPTTSIHFGHSGQSRSLNKPLWARWVSAGLDRRMRRPERLYQ